MADMMTKVKIKVVDDATDQFLWFHFCYMKSEVYYEFLTKLGITRSDLAGYISRWVEDDFGYKTSMTHSNDILVARKLIMEFYHKAYPYFFRETITDRQGWVRAWLTKHMEEELKYYE